MVRVLSFDVGVRNLAYCEFELEVSASESRIVRWDVIDVISKKNPSFEDLSDALLGVLNDLFYMHDDHEVVFDHVIIENQPVTMNPKIKSVAVMIFTFFRCIHMYTGTAPQVKFISAQRKLHALIHRPEGLTLAPSASLAYAEKKRLALRMCEHYLRVVMGDESSLAVLTGRKGKKDDMCDCFLQGVSFMEKELGLRWPQPCGLVEHAQS